MWPLSACHSASSHKILQISVDELWPQKRFSRLWSPPSWISKIIFGRVTAIGFTICYNVPNFIKIGRFFTEMWRFNDFQNGGHPSSWILKSCSFCHVALVDILFCFLVQNFAGIGQSVDELWPKKWFSRWQPLPSWILKISISVTWLSSGSISNVVYQISSKSDDFSLRYGDFTIFKMAAGRHLGF